MKASTLPCLISNYPGAFHLRRFWTIWLLLQIGCLLEGRNFDFSINAEPFPCEKKHLTNWPKLRRRKSHGTTIHVGKPSIRIPSYASPEANSCRFFRGVRLSDSKCATAFQNNKISIQMLVTSYRKILSLKCSDGFGKENQQFLYKVGTNQL